jgi:hypothetical protein
VKDDRLYVRLSREDKERLVEMSAEYGGVSNWILARMREQGTSNGLVRSPVEKDSSLRIRG